LAPRDRRDVQVTVYNSEHQTERDSLFFPPYILSDWPSAMPPPATSNELPPFQPDLMVGGLEVGVLVGVCLFGVHCVQTYMYLCSFKKDPWSMKAVVSRIANFFIEFRLEIIGRFYLSGAYFNVLFDRSIPVF